MNNIYALLRKKLGYHLIMSGLVCVFCLLGNMAAGQACPGKTVTSISSFPNTYYPGTSASLSPGNTSITVGAAVLGTDPIAPGDVLMIMQMQGAHIVATNAPSYGTGSGAAGGGYSLSGLTVGIMEYVVANSAVPVTGGTLTLQSGLAHFYQNSAYGTDGQYTYQLIRVPVYDQIKLTANITAPAWNGSSGGVMVLYAVDSILFNGFTVSASGKGFRGGACYALTGGSGTNADFMTLSTQNTNGSKGEGMAGSPRFIAGVDFGAEGYPGGSFGRGAPGNAGGGGTDGRPSANDQNTGGGGGGNAGTGGSGGNAWSSAVSTGGYGGAIFSQTTPSRMILGGGGGSGTSNNGTGTPSGGIASGGASGGGIVIAIANAFSGTGTINVSGANGNSTIANDGSGGGGGGGVALLYSITGAGLSNITVNANGGNGGSNSGSGAMHGPGGGGGGGFVYSNGTLNAATTSTGGIAGTTFTSSNYGATAGTNGAITQNITAGQLTAFPVNCTVLSVSFVSVSAQRQNGQVLLNWTMAGEINTTEYQIEKSTDGSNFTPAGNVVYKLPGAANNHYEFTDDNGASTTGVVYYRVKEIEWSGKYEYSWIVSVHIDGLTGKLTVYPCPANQSATVGFTSTTPGLVNLKLVDLKGGTIWQTPYQAIKGENTLQIPAVRDLADGLYFLQWSDGLNPQTIKLLVKH